MLYTDFYNHKYSCINGVYSCSNREGRVIVRTSRPAVLLDKESKTVLNHGSFNEVHGYHTQRVIKLRALGETPSHMLYESKTFPLGLLNAFLQPNLPHVWADIMTTWASHIGPQNVVFHALYSSLEWVGND